MKYQVSNLSDLELTELEDEIAREQRARQVLALRAIRNQKSFFLPRLTVGAR